MDNYKFRVDFLEDAKCFLDGLEEKETKLFTTSEKPAASMIKNFSKNYKTKFENLEQNITKLIIDFLRFETRPTMLIPL